MISVFKVKIPQNNKMSTLTSVDQILKTRVNSFHKGPFLNNPSSFTSILEIFPPIFNIFHLFILRYFTWMGSISHVISVFTALFFSFCCGWKPGQNWKHENGKMDNLRVALLLRLLVQERLGARQLVRKSLLIARERKDIFIRKDEHQNKLWKSD